MALFSPEKRRLGKDLITRDQCIRGGYQEDRDSFLIRSPTGKIWDDGDKFLLGGFQLGSRRKCFPTAPVRVLNHLPGEAVNCPT